MRSALMLAMALALGSCSPGDPSRPTVDELTQSLEGRVSAPLLDASLGDCEAGTLSGTGIPVQVCNYCAVGVQVASQGGGIETNLQAVRATGSLTFRRALSFDQPDIQPADPEGGVWVSSPDPSVVFANGETAMLSAQQMLRAGYRPGRTNLLGRTPDDVAANLLADSALRSEIIALVGACSPSTASTQPRTTASGADLTPSPVERAAEPGAPAPEMRACLDAGNIWLVDTGECRSSIPTPTRTTASAASDARYVRNPRWVARPTAEDFARLYPSAALNSRQEGRVLLDCAVNAAYRLDCEVGSEDPTGHGFGEAALRLSEKFQMAGETADGVDPAGGRVRVPIRFTLAH